MVAGEERIGGAALGLAPGRFYNAAVSAASVEDHIAFWQLIKRAGRLPDIAIFSIDHWALARSQEEVRWLGEEGVDQLSGEFSPDGSQLLFASPRSGNFEIYAVTLDDAGKTALSTNPNAVTVSQAAKAGTPLLPGMSMEAYIFIALVVLALAFELAYRMLKRRRARVVAR